MQVVGSWQRHTRYAGTGAYANIYLIPMNKNENELNFKQHHQISYVDNKIS